MEKSKTIHVYGCSCTEWHENFKALDVHNSNSELAINTQFKFCPFCCKNLTRLRVTERDFSVTVPKTIKSIYGVSKHG